MIVRLYLSLDGLCHDILSKREHVGGSTSCAEVTRDETRTKANTRRCAQTLIHKYHSVKKKQKQKSTNKKLKNIKYKKKELKSEKRKKSNKIKSKIFEKKE